MKNKWKLGSLLLCGLLLSGCGSQELLLATQQETQEEITLSASESVVGTESGTVTVYVCGAVKEPGVYTLAEGARLCDAIEAAGGFAKKACRDYWNLAEPLTDGQMFDIPTGEEAAELETDSEETDDGLVDLNTADAAALMTLPGVGEARAQAILAYRTEHGGFSSVEEIKNVSGIGDALFENMKSYITIH